MCYTVYSKLKRCCLKKFRLPIASIVGFGAREFSQAFCLGGSFNKKEKEKVMDGNLGA